MKDKPCPCTKDCSSRCFGCHSSCEKYMKWNKYHREYLDWKKDMKENDYHIRDFQIRCVTNSHRPRTLRELGFR